MRIQSKICNLLFCLMFISKLGMAQVRADKADETDTSRAAIAMSYSISSGDAKTIFNYLGDEIIQAAIKIVEKYGPENSDTIFSWRKSTPRLPVKEIKLRLTTSDDPNYREMAGLSPSRIPQDREIASDAATLLIAPVDLGEQIEIVVFVFLDKMFYDDLGKERPDGLTRLVTALAHELYGNVTFYLRMSQEEVEKPSPDLRVKMQINASQVGVDFLERTIKTLGNTPQSAKIVFDMRQALKREQLELKQWRNRR
jgi:hypothetical protein